MTSIAIIGAGIAGLSAACEIALIHMLDVSVFEAGSRYGERSESEPQDLICGVGGSGTLFGGKLCYPPASSGAWEKGEIEEGFNLASVGVFRFLPRLFEAGRSSGCSILDFGRFDDSVTIKNYNSDLLDKEAMRRTINNATASIVRKGIKIVSGVKVNQIECVDDDLFNLHLSNGETKTFNRVIVATGRLSSFKIRELLPSSVRITDQSPDLGIRLAFPSVPSHWFSTPGNDLKIKMNFDDIVVRTFCVCNSGDNTLVEWSGVKYYDGHYGAALSSGTTFAILARSPRLSGACSAVEYCNYAQSYLHKKISLRDFLYNARVIGADFGPYEEIISSVAWFASKLLKFGILGSRIDECSVCIPAVDRLNPLVETDSSCMTAIPGLYVTGDAAGVSRGFVQAAWLGRCAALHIIKHLNQNISNALMAG